MTYLKNFISKTLVYISGQAGADVNIVVSWSPSLAFKLGDSGSILGQTSTQGLKIIEKKELPLH
jgi:hypothetical protein